MRVLAWVGAVAGVVVLTGAAALAVYLWAVAELAATLLFILSHTV